MLFETLISGLIAPVMMLIQSASVMAILSGRDSGWQAQRRDDGSLPLRDVDAPLRLAHGVRRAAGARRLRRVVFAVRLDDAGDLGLDPRGPAGAMDREPGEPDAACGA